MSYLQALVAPTLAYPRQEGEIDLVAKIKGFLLHAGVSYATTWDSEPDIQAVADANSEVQRIAIGRNLSYRFRLTDINSTNERLVLVCQSPMEEYLLLVQEVVIPALKVVDEVTQEN